MPGTDREPSPPAAAAGELHDDESPDIASPPLPPFEPVFTLLTNTTSNTTVHPRIHYLFADDDPSILTTPAVDDPSHRAVIVDLAAAPADAPGRWAVSWASSLSGDFAVTAAGVAVQQNEGEAGALMLRVEGVEREPVDLKPESLPSSGSGALGREDVEGLAEEFKRRMGVLKKVVGEGERRRDVVAAGEGDDDEADDGDDEAVPDDAVPDAVVEGQKYKGKEKETVDGLHEATGMHTSDLQA
ncbi:hypothetical protein G7046_g2296 [Stylonectria norvegica]|nr:hypothetical protein G7046_g2296 [Stylonectria norvegica]